MKPKLTRLKLRSAMKRRVALLILLASAIATPGAQAPNAIQTATAALGVAAMRSIEFKGSGANFTVGQAYTAGEAWPQVNVNSLTATINFEAGSMRLEMIRTMPNPIPRGGGVAFQGEQRQTQFVSGTFAWNIAAPPAAGAPAPAPTALASSVVMERKLFLWTTPHGFLKAAQLNNAAVTNSGGNAEVSFLLDGTNRVTGLINAQGQVERVRYAIDNPVMGDMPVEVSFSGYRDFGGVLFPARIIQKQGGHPALDLNVTSVLANPIVEIAVPDSVRAPAPTPAIQVTAQPVAPGVHYLTGGSHHSVAIEMRDHVVIIEGPQTEARGLAVIAKTKDLIPNKPIRYIVNTHVHFDHSGGLRPFIDEGAMVVTHRSNRAFFEQAWAAPRTIGPDRLANSRRRPVFMAVEDRGLLGDGTRTIELHLIANNNHNDGIIMAYLPVERILIEADAYTPAAAGTTPPVTPNPFSVALADNIKRLNLDVATILALHGPRVTTMADLNAAIGRPATP